MARALIVGAVLLSNAIVAAAAATVTITLPPDQGSLKPGPGMEIAQTACQMCHSTDYITMQPRGGEAQWRAVVTKMITVFGAPIPDGDAQAIVQYLTREYGPSR